jgi:hypothetical protein
MEFKLIREGKSLTGSDKIEGPMRQLEEGEILNRPLQSSQIVRATLVTLLRRKEDSREYWRARRLKSELHYGESG